MHTNLTKIGVFYDGGLFQAVNNYYFHNHARRERITVIGLHSFIREVVAEEEERDVRLCQIVDAHFFRIRPIMNDSNMNQIYTERVLDDIMMREGVQTHYVPIRHDHNAGRRSDKGFDIMFALETYEQCVAKRFDVAVLFINDGDYTSLVRKLNAMGCRVMILTCDFQFAEENGRIRSTWTSPELLQDATYAVFLNDYIGDERVSDDDKVNGLFRVHRPHPSDLRERRFDPFSEHPPGDMQENSNVMMSMAASTTGEASTTEEAPPAPTTKRKRKKTVETIEVEPTEGTEGEVTTEGQVPSEWTAPIAPVPSYPQRGKAKQPPEEELDQYSESTIFSIKSGYGFIKFPPNNLFFHQSNVRNEDFNYLRPGDTVKFRIVKNDYDEDVATDVYFQERFDNTERYYDRYDRMDYYDRYDKFDRYDRY